MEHGAYGPLRRWAWVVPPALLAMAAFTQSLGWLVAASLLVGLLIIGGLAGRMANRRLGEAAELAGFDPVVVAGPSGDRWMIRPLSRRGAARLPGLGQSGLAVYPMQGPRRGVAAMAERVYGSPAARARELESAIRSGSWRPAAE